MTLDRLWAGWRSEYVGATGMGQGGEADERQEACVFCRILESGEPDDATQLVWRDERCAVLLNAYPYTSGHVLVMPVRHVGELEDLDDAERAALWSTATEAVVAVKAAYEPDGINLGANLGRASGAGIPGHLHVHCLPRWAADTNFLTSVAEARVLPEALPVSWQRLRAAWPGA